MDKIIIKKIFLILNSKGDDYYEVDPELKICNCPDFIYRRSSFDFNNPERLCKHLKMVLEYLKKKENESRQVPIS